MAATKIYDYESGKTETYFKPRPNFGQSTYRLQKRAEIEADKDDWLKRLKEAASTPQPRIYVGPIVSGEKIIASTKSDQYEFLQQNYSDALAIEMEGYGFLKAVETNSGLQGIVIRGISDLVDRKGEADASGSQENAAKHASAFAFELISKIDLEKEPHTRHLTTLNTSSESKL